jgi:hypothetical protein
VDSVIELGMLPDKRYTSTSLIDTNLKLREKQPYDKIDKKKNQHWK